jgi:DNA-binding GntR family transcriptional regulator
MPQESATVNKKEELEDVSYRFIIKKIIKNEIRPGDAILETELAEMLNISRTPVRQALGRLVAEGLLEKKRKKGCIIPFPTPEDAQKIFQAREIMETEMARQAALNATMSDIDYLKGVLDTETKALSSYNKEEYWLANEHFHFGIMKATKNPYLERYGHHIFRRSSIYIFFFDSFYGSRSDSKKPPILKSPVQHTQILEAVEKKNHDRAAELMKEHIYYSLQVLTRV